MKLLKLKSPQSTLITSAMALAIPLVAPGQQAQPAEPPAPSAVTVTTTTNAESHPWVSLQGTDLHLGSLPPVTFHGFVSQGFLYSSSYNYLDPHTTDGSFKFFEAGLNASINPAPRTRIAAQGFSYDVGDSGEYDVFLDYALAEYTFSDWLGVRGGRIRRPEGLYNDIQDLDMARTWVLLPQGIYNARWRDMYTSIDGGEFFGSLPLAQAGALSYELYSGLQRPKLNGGLALQKANMAPFQPLTDINSPWMSGGQLWWHTPLDGLRAGAALNYDQDLTFVTTSGRQSVGSPFVQHYSLEYLWKAWTFQAEYYTYSIDYHMTGGGAPDATRHIEPDSWFVSAAYRFNKWFEAGTYYTEYYQDVHNRNGDNLAVPSDASQKDVALSLRFDPTPWWTFKVEGHHLNGTGNLYDNKANPVRGDNGWWMLALKTTFAF